MTILIYYIIISGGISYAILLYFDHIERKWRIKYDTIKENRQLTTKTLRKLFYKRLFMTKTEYEAVRIKYQAAISTIKNLEATMTTGQLYEINNILWAKHLTLNQIENIISIEQSEENIDKEEKIREIIETN